jgi:hypothetical protein
MTPINDFRGRNQFPGKDTIIPLRPVNLDKNSIYSRTVAESQRKSKDKENMVRTIQVMGLLC